MQRLWADLAPTFPLPQDWGGPASLGAYMSLPPEAYAQLEVPPAEIQALGGRRFLLRLPRISVRCTAERLPRSAWHH